jgi:hypothetical protein
MNKQQYADKWSLKEWQTLCKYQDFVEAFWNDDFDKCVEIAANLRSIGVSLEA